jgi:hypothetical protein
LLDGWGHRRLSSQSHGGSRQTGKVLAGLLKTNLVVVSVSSVV